MPICTIVAGISEYVAPYNVKKDFSKKNEFDDSFDITKCLQKIEMPDLLHMFA